MRFRRKKNKHPIHYEFVLEMMEKRYKEKIPKHGDSWKDATPEFLLNRIIEEIEAFKKIKVRGEQVSGAVDIANFASMLVAVSLGYSRAWPLGYIPGRAFRSMGG